MSDLIINDKAIKYIQQHLRDKSAKEMRIFIGGGGCCSRFEITPVKKALAGDVTYKRSDLTIHVDKTLIESASSIEIGFDENRGLLINLLEMS